MTNIYKHSNANRVDWFLIYKDNKLSLNINDNGIGFDQDKVKKGTGLKSIYKRYGFEVNLYNEFKQMDWNSVDGSYSFFNIDTDNFLIYSDYLSFFFSSKGATFINKPNELIQKEKVIKEVKLSMYHSMKIAKIESFSNYTAGLLIKSKLNAIALTYHSINFYNFALEEFKTYCKID